MENLTPIINGDKNPIEEKEKKIVYLSLLILKTDSKTTLQVMFNPNVEKHINASELWKYLEQILGIEIHELDIPSDSILENVQF